MTKREALRQARQTETLQDLGFTANEAESLRRISRTLHRWHEAECGTDTACLVRGRWDCETAAFVYDDDGHPYWEFANGSGRSRYQRIFQDRERGARRRLRAILGQRNGRPAIVNGHLRAQHGGPVVAYIQTDPRGCAVYLLRPGDVPEGADPSSCYSNGIAVY